MGSFPLDPRPYLRLLIRFASGLRISRLDVIDKEDGRPTLCHRPKPDTTIPPPALDHTCVLWLTEVVACASCRDFDLGAIPTLYAYNRLVSPMLDAQSLAAHRWQHFIRHAGRVPPTPEETRTHRRICLCLLKKSPQSTLIYGKQNRLHVFRTQFRTLLNQS